MGPGVRVSFWCLEREVVGRTFIDGRGSRGCGSGLRSGLLVGRLLRIPGP